MQYSKFQDLIEQNVKLILQPHSLQNNSLFFFKLNSINPLGISDSSGNSVIVNVPQPYIHLLTPLKTQSRIGLKNSSIELSSINSGQMQGFNIIIKQIYFSNDKIQDLNIPFFLGNQKQNLFTKETRRSINRHLKLKSAHWTQPLSNQFFISLVNNENRLIVLMKRSLNTQKQLLPEFPAISLDQESLKILVKIKPFINKSELFLRALKIKKRDDISKRIVRNMIFPNITTEYLSDHSLEIHKKTYSKQVVQQLIRIYNQKL